MSWIVIILYFLCLSVIFGYAILQFGLSIAYQRAKREWKETAKALVSYPMVTVQLPVYNEKYVVKRLLESIVLLNYPKDRLQIQVLDDSTDATTDIVKETIARLTEKGHAIDLILRDNREGFKAGALENGMSSAKGEFIAIFDADFVPDPDFLLKTLPQFTDPTVGLVQTRWEHLNRNSSLLTKLQAFGLDAHFSIEQVGRSAENHFINFNGTGGVWRRATIDHAGGWEHDTLTEDLDLSYRAQLKGWKFVYLEQVASPAELPISITALKNQQYRWTKGGAENFKKMAPKLLFSKGLRFTDRLHGLAHLFNSSVYLFVFLSALLSLPVVYYAAHNELLATFLTWMAVFFVSTFFLMRFYWVSFREIIKQEWKRGPLFVWRFFQYLTISLGLSYSNTHGIVLAYLGKKTAFVRTPKFNVSINQSSKNKNVYVLRKLKVSTLIEFGLAIYFLIGILVSYKYSFYGMIPFQLMLFIGFMSVASYTLRELFSE
jgi:cellulose synthase/poly-beta-1,6-N-acetylglucosamine synthase-like glycosyltransferase